ncbi:hypothetical protein G6011_04048 [Alternaria panax]|uniref:Uncharacterized protein n=1 Tax=Alternaria panax TaxID=48097 RepID=A0AAD4IFU2_9PLEO|nr:hypothetical protein G6011_04048 [Alternaria panax]
MSPPEKKARTAVEATPEAPCDEIRSVYGDAHAATDNAMLAAHAQHLQQAGVIDGRMVYEFTQPYSKLHVHSVRYTSAYLALHPDYTGKDADIITTWRMAMRRQREDDEAEKKILKDYRAGRIDIWGNPIVGLITNSRGALVSHVGDGQQRDVVSLAYESQCPSYWSGHDDCDTTETDNSSSGNTVTRTPQDQRRRTNHLQKASMEAVTPSTSADIASSPAQGSFSKAVPLTFEQQLTHYKYYPNHPPNTPAIPPRLALPMRKTPNHTPHNCTPLATSKKPTTVSSSFPQPSPQRPRRIRTVTPLRTSPGNTDYTKLNYCKVTALCWKRGIPSGGNMQEVRNTLIQDDSAVREGEMRKKAMATSTCQREYKTVAPEDGEASV